MCKTQHTKIDEAIKIIKQFGKDFFTCDFFYNYKKMKANPKRTIKWAKDCIQARKVIDNAES